jgi:hypothetical protein
MLHTAQLFFAWREQASRPRQCRPSPHAETAPIATCLLPALPATLHELRHATRRPQALILSRRKRMLERAERWYTEVKLKRNVFRGWCHAALREHRVTLNQRYVVELDKAKRGIHEHYQGQISELQ